MHTADGKEIGNFAKDAPRWWDSNGPFAPLHQLNPVRLSYIKSQICAHYGRDANSLKAFAGLNLLDIGCGGGLVCEPMARLGASVTGIDADSVAIGVAQEHAAQGGLSIQYKNATTDDVITSSAKAQKFDVVLALEIIEHVADVDLFVEHCMTLCKPGGIVIFSTLNRTAKSFALGKIAAEYILGLVPRGTHDWKKFIRPSELARAARALGGRQIDCTGMVFDPLRGGFRLSPGNVDVNYFMSFKKGTP